VSAPDPRLGEIEAQQTKAVTDAMFGDVLRIIWTTYYFGADLQWHNARTGHVEQAETLLEEIEASEGDWGWLMQPADVAYLLTELRKRDNALARVDALADELAAEAIASRNVEREIRKGPPSTLSFVHAQHATIAHNHASRIRAAVTAAKGDGE